MNKNYKLILGIILGLLISGRIVYGITESIIESENVIYENTDSHGSYTNVQDSIDELYRLSGVQSTEWKEEILKGNDPVFKDTTLIPVTIESNGDVYYANKNSKWYSYAEKRWANAIKLVTTPSKEYNTGDKIEEEDIESYFVWIPRYKYKLWGVDNGTDVDATTLTDSDSTKYTTSSTQILGKAKKIDIKFEPITENNPSSETSKNGDWITHPAFTLNNKQLKGIWVGKFETGYNQMNEVGGPIDTGNWSQNGAQQNTIDTSRIIVKPNVYSWRSIKVYNIFMNAYNYLRDKYDSHMMKNTEWGAVAYLSHSAYGIGNEININNNSSYMTGYSAAADTDQSSFTGDNTNSGITEDKTQSYDTPTGSLASTTGNITGIYDMSGGSHEYVAGYSKNNSTKSGFSDEQLKQYPGYFDKYPDDSAWRSTSNRILGDATGEMGPFYNYYDKDGTKRYHNAWYADYSDFVDSTNPWFLRGSIYHFGVLAGQFYFATYTGGAYSGISSRVVLAPQ